MSDTHTVCDDTSGSLSAATTPASSNAEALQRARSARALYGDHPTTAETMATALTCLRGAPSGGHWAVHAAGLRAIDAPEDTPCESPTLGADLHGCGVVALRVEPTVTAEDLAAFMDGLDACARARSTAASWSDELAEKTSGRVTIIVPDASTIAIAQGSRGDATPCPGLLGLATSLAPSASQCDAATPEMLARVIEQQHQACDAQAMRSVGQRIARAASATTSPETTEQLRRVFAALSPEFQRALLRVPSDASERDVADLADIAALAPFRDVIEALETADQQSRLPSSAAILLFKRLSNLSTISSTDQSKLAETLGIAQSLVERDSGPGLDEIIGSQGTDNDASDEYGSHLRRMANEAPADYSASCDAAWALADTTEHQARLALALAQDETIPARLRSRGYRSFAGVADVLQQQGEFALLLEATITARSAAESNGQDAAAAEALRTALTSSGGVEGVLTWLASESCDSAEVERFITDVGAAPVLAVAERSSGRQSVQLRKLAARALDAMSPAALMASIHDFQDPGPITRTLLHDRIGSASVADARAVLDAMRRGANDELACLGFTWAFAGASADERVSLVENALKSEANARRSLAVEAALEDGQSELLDLVATYAAGDLRQKPRREDIDTACAAFARSRQRPDRRRLLDIYEGVRHEPGRRADGSCALVAEALRRHTLTPRSAWLVARWSRLPALLRRLPGTRASEPRGSTA